MPEDFFDAVKNGILNVDPVHFIESNLTLDGKPFRIHGNGYKPMADICRYIGTIALGKNAKPIVLVKGRQIGATSLAAALELFFVSSGLFGVGGRPPIRVMHCFPQLDLASAYTKTKLNTMITGAMPSNAMKKGRLKSIVESRLDKNMAANDSLFLKQFEGGNHIWIESTGLDASRLRGRQLCLETELPTPNGFIKLKDLKEGDQLFDENGKVCHVMKLHPIQETPEAYRVTFDDGTSIDACAEHLWSTQTKHERNKKKNPSIRNTKEIKDTLKAFGENNHSIKNCVPVEYYYYEKKLLIDPYLLGIWLGDGSRYGQIETADPEVLANFDHKIVESSNNKTGNGFSQIPSRSRSYRVAGLTTQLTELGLVKNPGKNNKHLGFYHKHIPSQYLQASYEQRLSLLQGLMDSDGCCYKDGRCEFVQVESRKELFFQVKELAESLGIKTRVYYGESWRYERKYQNKYSLIFMTTQPVFRLQRKLKNIPPKLTSRSLQRFIVSVEPIETKPMRCITVDSPSHLYLVTRSFVPTHNTIDVMFYDEVQEMKREALANAKKILVQAQYGKNTQGVQVYFGTPKQAGTAYWEIWKSSSQQFYHLCCGRCGKYFPLYTPGSNDWEKIWLHGYIVKCTSCNFEQDKLEAAERGKWIASNEDPRAEYIGYHINQLYNPRFTKEDIIAEKPENSPINTERAYQNEVLGEFFAGSAAPITPDELQAKCADIGRKFTARIAINEPRRVYAGFDWGQKVDASQIGVSESAPRQTGQSYSCAVILTADNPHILSVEFATKLKRNDMATKKEIVEEMFRQYSVRVAVGDIGYANDLTEILQKEHGDKFLASRAMSGTIKNHVKFVSDVFPKEIQFERDYYIAELYSMMKEGRIRFPYGSYEQIGWLINHCCSMEIKVTMDRGGELKQRYVKGSTPNDGFCSLLNAYLAFRWDISGGFNINDPNRMIIIDPKKKKQIPAVLGYFPTRG